MLYVWCQQFEAFLSTKQSVMFDTRDGHLYIGMLFPLQQSTRSFLVLTLLGCNLSLSGYFTDCYNSMQVLLTHITQVKKMIFFFYFKFYFYDYYFLKITTHP